MRIYLLGLLQVNSLIQYSQTIQQEETKTKTVPCACYKNWHYYKVALRHLFGISKNCSELKLKHKILKNWKII